MFQKTKQEKEIGENILSERKIIKEKTHYIYICTVCNVGLCVTPCFSVHHTKSHFKTNAVF